MRQPSRFSISSGPASLALLTALLYGCGGPGAVGAAVRPADPTAASALGEGGETACHDVASGGEPLVVDWKPEQRGDLEEAMHDGVAVVEYTCAGIRLLKGCHIEGKYGFLGMTKREQVVRLQSSDELKANLPSFGGALAVKVGGEMQRGASLDIAMITVGKKRTTWEDPTTEDLKGKCDGATHYVRGALVGAFVLQTGTKGKVQTAVEMFGVEASGASSSEKDVRNTDGDPDDCKKASPDSEKAPSQCGAPVRLVLAPVIKKDAAKEPAAAPPAAQMASEETTCPTGLVFADGKCTAAASAAAYQCKSGDAAECQAQCDKGNAGSCGTLGVMYATGYNVSADDKRAADLLQKACDGGEAPSCVNLGRLVADGRGRKEDAAAAAKLYEKAFQNGDAQGAGLLGHAYQDGKGVKADPARAATLFQQACDGGDDGSCGAAGNLFASGQGVTRDTANAADFFMRACQGSDAESCNALGELYENGDGVRKDAIAASIYYRRGCPRGSGTACVNLGRLLQGGGAGGSPDEAKRMFEQGCIQRVTLGCAALKLAFGDSRPVFPDVMRQQALMRSCTTGNARDCAASGVMDLASGNTQGKFNLQMACQRGDGWACAMQKFVK